MAASIGRKMLVKKNNVALAGVTEKSISINHEPVDISSDDDLGYRKLLNDPASKSIDISVSGVASAEALRNIGVLSGVTHTMLTDITFEWPDGDKISGEFFMASYEERGATGDKVTFSASFQSSGAWTFTPAP
jgi:predicted secreted protein